MPLGIQPNISLREGRQRARARRPMLLQPAPPLPRGVLSGPRRVIDPDSGLVSTETFSREFQVSEYRWDTQYEELLKANWEDSDDDQEITADEALRAEPRRRQFRVPPLQHLAVDTFIKNLGSVTYETIQNMPSLKLEFLWREISERCTISLNTWKVFSKAIGRQEGAILKQFLYAGSVPIPVPSLPIYTKPLYSTTFDFLVHLLITTPFTTAELVQLSTLTNLVALDIANPKHGKQFDPSFGDRVIKTWSEGASRGEGFQVLRILKLQNFPEITNNCFQYLKGFPVLAIFEVIDCSFNGLGKLGADKLGWETHPDGGSLEILQSDCVKHIMALRATLGLPVKPVRRSAAEPLSDKSKITMMPRENIPAFLTEDPASSSTTEQNATVRNAAYQDAERRVKSLELTSAGREKLKKTGLSRFETVDFISRSRIREDESWEFRTLTSLNRISELRNDEDLRAAGLNIGDSVPIVSGEIMSAIPIASIRLGPELANERSHSNLHQPFYSGGTSDQSLKYTSRISGVGARGFVFTRVKIPVAQTSTQEQAEAAGDEAGGSGNRKAKRRKINGEKKKQVGEFWAGFMGGL